MTTGYRPNMDWMLADLAKSVPFTRYIVLLSADGLRMAQHNTAADTADRLAAACAGLQSLAAAIASEFPKGDGRMRLVVIEVNGGYFYMMAAGAAPTSRCSPTARSTPACSATACAIW